MRRESPPYTNVMNEQQPHAPPMTSTDLHLELLQRVTNQLNELSVNIFQGSRVPVQWCQYNPLMKREHKMLNHHEKHREGRNISATIVEKMGMVCISALTQEDILEMAREEVLEDK